MKTKGKPVEETLKDILRMLEGYGSILRHVDQRFDTLEKMLELVRVNQTKITERESALEAQCRTQHCRINETLQSMARRITNLESRMNPMPEPSTEMAEETP